MIISGKELSAKLKAGMAAEVATFGEKYGRVPHLVVILVGEDPGSVSYVTGKAKASAESAFAIRRFASRIRFSKPNFWTSSPD